MAAQCKRMGNSHFLLRYSASLKQPPVTRDVVEWLFRCTSQAIFVLILPKCNLFSQKYRCYKFLTIHICIYEIPNLDIFEIKQYLQFQMLIIEIYWNLLKFSFRVLLKFYPQKGTDFKLKTFSVTFGQFIFLSLRKLRNQGHLTCFMNFV